MELLPWVHGMIPMGTWKYFLESIFIFLVGHRVSLYSNKYSYNKNYSLEFLHLNLHLVVLCHSRLPCFPYNFIGPRKNDKGKFPSIQEYNCCILHTNTGELFFTILQCKNKNLNWSCDIHITAHRTVNILTWSINILSLLFINLQYCWFVEIGTHKNIKT